MSDIHLLKPKTTCSLEESIVKKIEFISNDKLLLLLASPPNNKNNDVHIAPILLTIALFLCMTPCLS